jgi:ribulose-phosphate 3-epimerase
LIYPSILSANFASLGEQIRSVAAAGADGIHLDVMDGHFVPNITFGPVVVRWIREVCGLPYWAHLMIDDPGRYVEPFRGAGVDGLFVHPETVPDLKNLLRRIRGLGLGAGAALKPETPIDVLDPVLRDLDRVLILTVHPGFGGQQLMPEGLEKVRRLRERLHRVQPRPLIDVDGGIDVSTLELVARSGADVFIIGNAIFGTPDPSAALQNLRTLSETIP